MEEYRCEAVEENRCVDVAVLLTTYNGSKFVTAQVQSLAQNSKRFTLHWVDDHSTDQTRELVRTAAGQARVALREWRHPEHQGGWGSFFYLLDCVDADIYLFCDHDDIWQPGKIDATVASLLPKLPQAALCFSDPLLFKDDRFHDTKRVSTITKVRAPRALEPLRCFMSPCAWGHTQGFTRALRDIYLKHSAVAKKYSFGHDWWMYILAVTMGDARMLTDVPTTLYRQHGANFTTSYFDPKNFAQIWHLQQLMRQGIARQARGFLIASEALPQGTKLDELRRIATLVSTLDRRQSATQLVKLVLNRCMWPSFRGALWLSLACLASNAPEAGFEQFKVGQTQSGTRTSSVSS